MDDAGKGEGRPGVVMVVVVDCPGTRRAGKPGNPFTRAGETGKPLARLEPVVRGFGGCKRPLLPHLVEVRMNTVSLQISYMGGLRTLRRSHWVQDRIHPQKRGDQT